ncbi:ubiquitin-like domain-containing protein [Tersicoccus sp. MR15.9]|uniref:ubiquitin-like domain-containing protein n=1 Tax=Tersicoccus mangrovi TaxID=3121635 RepID=UPI002FE67D43
MVLGAVLVGVLAVAGAVGLAVAAPARTVTITVSDGAAAPTSTSVQSGAGRVGDVLAQAGVTTGAQDAVDPGLDEQVGDDDTIHITRARELDLLIDGQARHLTTPLHTVGELIHSLALPAGSRAAVPDDRDLTTVPRPLAIATPKRVTITADGRTRTVRTAAPTVRQAITEQGITIGPRDQVAPDPGSVPTAQLRISVTRIGTGATVDERENVPFSTEVRQDPTRYAGESVVLREGVPGVIVRTFTTRMVDGQPRGRVLVGSTTVRQPVSRILSVGTLDRPGQAPPADGAVPGPGSAPAPAVPAPAGVVPAPATPAPAEPAQPTAAPSDAAPVPSAPAQSAPLAPVPAPSAQEPSQADAVMPWMGSRTGTPAPSQPAPSQPVPAPSLPTPQPTAPSSPAPQPTTGSTGGATGSIDPWTALAGGASGSVASALVGPLA